MKTSEKNCVPTARGIKRSALGFTFVEMILTATIFAIVMGTLYAALRSGMQAHSVTDRRSEQLYLLRALRRDLNEDLSSAYADPDEFEYCFSVERQSEGITISFYSVPSEYQLRNGFAGDLRLIEYSLVKADEQGMGLERSVSPVVAGQVLDRVEAETLMDNLKSGDFSFFDGQTWVNEWMRLDQLPKAVRFEFSQPSALHVCRVTVYVPCTSES